MSTAGRWLQLPLTPALLRTSISPALITTYLSCKTIFCCRVQSGSFYAIRYASLFWFGLHRTKTQYIHSFSVLHSLPPLGFSLAIRPPRTAADFAQSPPYAIDTPLTYGSSTRCGSFSRSARHHLPAYQRGSLGRKIKLENLRAVLELGSQRALSSDHRSHVRLHFWPRGGVEWRLCGLRCSGGAVSSSLGAGVIRDAAESAGL